MTIEERLKDLILSKFVSMREFSAIAEIPQSSLATILSRGISNSSVNNVLKICKALGISADALGNGEIKPREIPAEPPTDPIEVREILNDAKLQLSRHAQHLTINGKPVDIELTESISDALDIGYEMAKKKAKAKRTTTKTITQSNKNGGS